MTTPAPKKTVLEKVAADSRFTIAEVEGYREELETLKDNAETLNEKLDSLIGLDFDDLRDMVSNIGDLNDLTDAFDTISENVTKAEEIKEVVESFIEAAEGFIEQSEYWVDREADKDDRAQAREEMVGIADTLLSNESELTKMGVDLNEAY